MARRAIAINEHLRRQLVGDPPAELLELAERAIELTVAEHADRLIDFPGSPPLPAGTVVEVLALDQFVD